jgi:hypothetical protein
MITASHPAPLWPSWLRFLVMLLVLVLLDTAWAWSLLQSTGITISYAHASGAANSNQALGWLFTIGWSMGLAINALFLWWASRQAHKAEALAAFISILWLTAVVYWVYVLALFGALISDALNAAPNR